MSLKDKAVVGFGPPKIAPGVPTSAGAEAAVAKYNEGIAKRRQAAALPTYNTPVGGGAAPHIPMLNEQAPSGMTMADYAASKLREKLPPEVAAGFGPPPPVSATGQMAPNPFTKAANGLQLFPNDILPEAAKSDPNFQQGPGSMFAVNQPHLAQKYGVIRGQKHVPAQQLSSSKGGLSKETTEGLQALHDAQVRAAQNHENKIVEEESKSSGAGQAAKLSPPQAKLDDLDWARIRDAVTEDIINNKAQREIIESRITPMDITDLVLRGSVTQVVPIVPGKLEFQFESVSGEIDLALKRLITKEARSLDVSDRYIEDKFSMMSACAGLRAINGLPLPDHRDENGRFSEENFWNKFTIFCGYPFHLIASAGTNFYWFDQRVRKLFVAEAVKNG